MTISNTTGISPINENMIFWMERTNEEAQAIFDFESEQF